MIISTVRMLIFFLTSLLLLTTLAAGGSYPEGSYRDVDDQEVMNMVQEGIDLIQNEGDLAFSVISKKNGRFHRDNLLLYVYDFKVTLCAHPTSRSRIGTNLKGTKDVQGKKFRDEIVQNGLSGGGWTDYAYKDHGGHGLHFRRAYSKAVDHNEIKYIVVAETEIHEKTETYLSEQTNHGHEDNHDDKHHH